MRIFTRQYGKKAIECFNHLNNLYRKGILTYQEYIEKTALAKVLLCGADEEDAIQWAVDKLTRRQNDNRSQ